MVRYMWRAVDSAAVQIDDAPEPGEKLHIQWAVEPELLSELGQLVWINLATLISTYNQQGSVPWDHVHKQENH